MDNKNNLDDKNELFMSSQLMMLISYTLFSVILIGECFIMGWELWAVFLIVAGVSASWYMHINRIGSDGLRMWIISILMMATFFFYGTHETSTYDLAIVITAVIVLYTMTGIHALLNLCLITYYITMTYELINMVRGGTDFDALLVTRTILHFAMVTMICWIGRTIIDKWNEVLGHSREEINMLTAAANRLGDFLASISHEIRTPINAILGLCDMGLENEEDEEKRARLTSIEEAGRKIGEQISDILDFSEIDRGDLTNNCEDFMLSSLLNDIVNEIRSYMKKETELIIDVDASIPAVMNSDPGKIRKILWHLITNGLKFTNDGGVYVHISSKEHDYGINLCFEVRDTGIGMNEEQLEMIYDSFYKADSGRTRKTGGLGLGVPVVHGFVCSLGGFMTVESEPENGTMVRVSIPCKVVDSENCMSVANRETISLGAYLHFEKYSNPNVREFYDSMVKNIVRGLKVSMHRVDNARSLRALVENKKLTHLFAGPEEYNGAVDFMEELAKDIIVTVVANPEELQIPDISRVRILPKPFYCFPVVGILNSKPEEEAEEKGRIFFPQVKVLIVDDEPMNLVVSTGMFKGYGMIVSTCESGPEAIDLCRDNQYDIIFMDHMMPVMDGVEAMKRIRGDLSRSKTSPPFVAFTANAVSSAREMFKREGFDGFVSKPVDRVELERVMKNLLPNSYVIKPLSECTAGSASLIPKAAADTDEAMEFAPAGRTVMERLSAIGIDTGKGMYYSQNDEDFYKTLLEQFVKESVKKRLIMTDALGASDLDAYTIQVHSIKSTARMIGANDLSEAARLLEEAAKSGDRTYIDSNHEVMLTKYDRVLHAIRPETAKDGAAEDAGDAEEIFEFGPEAGQEGGNE